MRILITGSSGHLGEALMRVLQKSADDVIGLDLKPSPYTTHVGSIADRGFVKQCLEGVDAVLHTATLHKPHVATHTYQAFVDTNLTGTLNLLEESVAQGVQSFIFTSTTSTFGDTLTPVQHAPAVWITEESRSMPKNIYGVTKSAAEDLCELFYRNHNLPCLILKTSRFFPEEDDKKAIRDRYEDANSKANELLYRRVDLADVVTAHLLALSKAPQIGFSKYIISATSVFSPEDLATLSVDAPSVVERLYPSYPALYQQKNWTMFPSIDRVYVNQKARQELNWLPSYDFSYVLECLQEGKDFRSPLSVEVGRKGYHDQSFAEGPYPVSNY